MGANGKKRFIICDFFKKHPSIIVTQPFAKLWAKSIFAPQTFFSTMIPQAYFFKLIILLTPIISSLTALLTLWFSFVQSRQQQRRVQRYLLLYFLCAFVSWTGMAFYFAFPTLFAALNSLFLLTFILIQLFFFAFVFEVTKTQYNEQFAKAHYIAPALLFLALTVLMATTPFSQQVALIKNLGVYTNQPKLFYGLSNNKMAIRLVFTVIYTALGFYRLYKYRRFIVNYSANHDRSQLQWVSVLLFLSIILILIPAIGVVITRATYLSSAIAILPIGLLVMQYAYLNFQVISKNYITIEAENDNPFNEKTVFQPESVDVTIHDLQKKQALSAEKFEAYITTQKPYLNPDLKITDLVHQLGINRTYISGFVNTQYGVNFSRYINQCRLNEFNALAAHPDHSHKTKKELAEMAGFNDYKSYLRFKNSI